MRFGAGAAIFLKMTCAFTSDWAPRPKWTNSLSAWPSGHVDHWRDIPADQQIIVREGAPEWSVYKKHA